MSPGRRMSKPANANPKVDDRNPRAKHSAIADREAAKAKAEELAAAFRKEEPPRTADCTLATLFDMYDREVTPSKALTTQRHDRRAAKLFLRAFGSNRLIKTLSRRDWDAFIRERRSGSLRPPGVKVAQPVGDRIIEQDLRWMLAVLNWATRAGDKYGRPTLERNPLAGLSLPREANPHRPTLSDDEYVSMVEALPRVHTLLTPLLVLVHETGHRVGSVRQMRWADVDLTAKVVRWPAESDKIGFEHVTPLSAAAVDALDRLRRTRAAIGDGWVFPAPKKPDRPCSRHVVKDWWERCEGEAKTVRVAGRGFHSLRRKFATELKAVPLPDLCALGGWKEPMTVVKCYQRPDEQTMRAALEQRRVVRVATA